MTPVSAHTRVRQTDGIREWLRECGSKDIAASENGCDSVSYFRK